MAEAHQARMQNEVEEMVQTLERDHIRKMQVSVSFLESLNALAVSVCASLIFFFHVGSHVQMQCRLL